MSKLERAVDSIIAGYIPKHRTCAIEECKRKYLREKEKNIILPALTNKVELMGSPLDISITQHWDKQQPDMSVCKACKEVIYGTQYLLTIMVNEEPVEQTNAVKLCEICYLKRDDT